MRRKSFELGERVLILTRDTYKYQKINYEDEVLEGKIINKYDLPDDAIYDVFVTETYDGYGTVHGATFRRFEGNIFRTHEEATKGKIRQINELIKERQEQIKFLKNIKEELKNKRKDK